MIKNSYFKILQGSVATLIRWSWKILSYFVANLSKTLHINSIKTFTQYTVKNSCRGIEICCRHWATSLFDL